MSECMVCGRPTLFPDRACSKDCADRWRFRQEQEYLRSQMEPPVEIRVRAPNARRLLRFDTIMKVSLTQATRRAQIRERMRELTFTCGWRSIVDGGTPAMKHWYLRHILLGNKRLPRVNPFRAITYNANPFLALLRATR